MSLDERCLHNSLTFLIQSLKEKYTIPGYTIKPLSDNRCLHLAKHIHQTCWTTTGITEPYTMVVIQPYIDQLIRILVVLTPQIKIGYLSFLTNVRVRCNLDCEYQHHPDDQSEVIAQWLTQSTKEELSPELFNLNNQLVDDVYITDYQQMYDIYIQSLHNLTKYEWPSPERIITFTDYGVLYFLEEIQVVHGLLKGVNQLTGKPFSEITHIDLTSKLNIICQCLTYALNKLKVIQCNN